MTVTVRPDPSRPRGGFAILAVPSDRLAEAAVTVAILNPYTDRYLGGDGFQAEPVAFGPYPVVRDGAEAQVSVGPEIVNQIEEYAQLRITVGSVTAMAIWPDTVVPAPGAARLGGLMRPGERARPAGPATVVRREMPVGAVRPEDPPDVPAPDAARDDRRDGWTRGRILALAAAGIAALGLAVALVLWSGSGPGADVAAVPDAAPVPAVPPAAAVSAPARAVVPALADRCAPGAIGALRGQDFAPALAQVRACGGAVTPEAALVLVEDAAARGDPVALMLFGTLYDDTATDADLETAIGLSFTDQPAIAADYYARARDAGDPDAAARLGAVCARLAARTDTPSQSARSRLCGP